MPFILRRLAFYAVAAWVALTLNFFIPRAMPGNAVQGIMDKFPNLQPSAYKALEAMLGVGHPGSLLNQYGNYLVDVFHFNFGTDVSEYPASVTSLLAQSIPWTLVLVGTATVIAFMLGTGLGILAGWRHGGWLDRSLPGLMFLQAIPYFFLALLLLEVFAIKVVHWFPIAQGYDGQLVSPGWHWNFLFNALDHSLLPAITIVVTSVAGWMLQMRNVMITTIGEDYVVAAQAKGLSSRRVVFTYAARNALLPQLQGFGLALGYVVSGALVMEIVFSYPGIGLLLLNAVTSNDYPLMQAIFLVITFAVLLANLVVDLIIVFFDPRVRAREAAR
jgi:peptide/nickel transport system permease protein